MAHHDPYESPPETSVVDDPHSGTRLVVLAFILPMIDFAGWIAYRAVRDVSLGLIGWEASARAGYAASAVAMVVMGLFCLQAWNAFRSSPTSAEDATASDDDLPAEREEDYDD